jgi:hypothetical protein
MPARHGLIHPMKNEHDEGLMPGAYEPTAHKSPAQEPRARGQRHLPDARAADSAASPRAHHRKGHAARDQATARPAVPSRLPATVRARARNQTR